MNDLPVSLVVVTAAALGLDRLLGEPRLHPLVWFGHAATRVEARLNIDASRLTGTLALGLLVVPLAVSIYALQSIVARWPTVDLVFGILVLMFVIGWQSMKEHAHAVSRPLVQRDMQGARQALSMIVSRDTHDMNPEQVAGSVIESILENGHDSVFASIFWFALAGPVGAIVHRLVNTLDAMWGYRSERFDRFGWAAARLDDALGYIPARLTAVSYAICGHTSTALRCWREQAPQHKSPNAGVVMATGAGALGISIGGPTRYDGVLQDKPLLGHGNRATDKHINASVNLVHRALGVWLAVFAVIGLAT